MITDFAGINVKRSSFKESIDDFDKDYKTLMSFAPWEIIASVPEERERPEMKDNGPDYGHHRGELRMSRVQRRHQVDKSGSSGRQNIRLSNNYWLHRLAGPPRLNHLRYGNVRMCTVSNIRLRLWSIGIPVKSNREERDRPGGVASGNVQLTNRWAIRFSTTMLSRRLLSSANPCARVSSWLLRFVRLQNRNNIISLIRLKMVN